jgi:hypothetical protein
MGKDGYQLPGSIKWGKCFIGSGPAEFSNSASWGYLVNYCKDKGKKLTGSGNFLNPVTYRNADIS